MPMTPKEMIRLLMKNGFVRMPSNSGAHQKLKNPATGITVTVSMHAKEMKKGTEQDILKQAGLK